MKHKITSLLSLALMGILSVSVAHAGLKAGYEVQINTSGSITTAVGSVGKARNSADSTQYIFCYTLDNTFGYCGAKTAAGTFKACTTSNSDQIAVIRSIGVNSHVAFKTDGASTSCYSVQVVNGSHLEPATP